MTFDLLQPIYPLSYDEHAAMVMFINGRGPEEDIPKFITAMRLDKRLRETTHFYHGVSLDVDNNMRWYVIAHMAVQHSDTATPEHWYGEHGALTSQPLPDDVRKEAEEVVLARMRMDFFHVLGLEEYIG
ncbi:hypothetical protein HOU00_gp165 [Caulobacter phage CcrPW]|uniref:Uncharacterized protein n=1 Tax=Caulobacter phage CcrPW TaxID=2283271 RepID=A0A385EBD5_9CAUD|nr:hypothetical protein HOU00_gp165 [Caulobacter phage CcrPW]AXQ68960.1 hypothetical protein CcrPW_gp421c [Caulobacter phage CcrPW]